VNLLPTRGYSTAPPINGPIRVVAAAIYRPGLMKGRAYRPGAKAAEMYRPGVMAGESVNT
jgi:hypothetical protein